MSPVGPPPAATNPATPALNRRIEVVQRMAGHSNTKTAGLYDRRADDIRVSEVEKVGI